MIDPKFLDDLAKKITENVPESLLDAQKDFGRNIRAMLESALAKLNLVTREEFELERQQLKEAEQALADLHTRLAALEEGKK